MAFGDVCLLFGTLLSLGIALPGLLLTWLLLLPEPVDRARARLRRTPGRCLGLGIGGLLVAALPLRIAFAIPGLGLVGGWLGVVALLAVASLGAAGLAALMGERLRAGNTALSPGGATLRGAVALELALAFPIVGWFVALPLVLIVSLGAVGFALLRPVSHPASPGAFPTPPAPFVGAAASSHGVPAAPPPPPTFWTGTEVQDDRHAS